MISAILTPLARITVCSAGLAIVLFGKAVFAQEPVENTPPLLPPPPQVDASPPPAEAKPLPPPPEVPLPAPDVQAVQPAQPPLTGAVPPPPADLLTPASHWKFELGGYVHGAYRWVQEPQNYNLAGRNNGFQLEQARVTAEVRWKSKLAVRISFEGASEDRLNQSFPGGQLTTRLRDAYLTWAPFRALRVTVGQMVTPWDLDSMRSDAELPFVSRSVPVEGVQPTEGFTTRGMGTDRNLGISIHSGFIGMGAGTSFRYSVFAGNGNGQNQVLNDNNIPAIFGRAEFAYFGKKGLPVDWVRPMYSITDDFYKPIINLGLAAHWNPRTAGNLPDLIRETDVGVAADLASSFFGVEIQAGLLYVKTIHDTLSAVPDMERFGWWAHIRYSLPRIPVEIIPAYRIGSYAPRAHLSTAAATEADAKYDASFTLLYHTIGVTVRPARNFPLHVGVNYTFTSEQSPNVLDNDRFEVDAVAAF